MSAQPVKKTKKALKAEALAQQRAEIAALEAAVFGDIPRAAFPGALAETEKWWRDHYDWLKKRGYLLRPRYAPDWVPSWQGTKKSFLDCEDGHSLRFNIILDATRISDGAFVTIKRLRPSVHPYEVDIGRFLSSEPLASDPANHCVPFYEVLQVPDDDDMVLVVMPLLRRYGSPRFDTFGEAVDFFQQLFESMQFMHKHRIAHRDLMGLNIMMDGSKMFPHSFHPMDPDLRRDYSGQAKYYTRTQRPPKYYIIDFGISRRYSLDDEAPLEPPIFGGDKTVPEFQKSSNSCNPFPTDVYYIGNLIRKDFLQSMAGFEFMTALVADMVQDDPSQRPTAAEVIERFGKIKMGLSSWKLRSRVVKNDDIWPMGFYRSFGHWFRRIGFIITRTPSIPVLRL